VVDERFVGADEGVALADGFLLVEAVDGVAGTFEEELGELHGFVASGHVFKRPKG
jgi:hypothetical protein